MASVWRLVTCQTTLSSIFVEADPLSDRPAMQDSEEVIEEKVRNIFKQYFIAFFSIWSRSPKLK